MGSCNGDYFVLRLYDNVFEKMLLLIFVLKYPAAFSCDHY